MNYEAYIKNGLKAQDIPTTNEDIPYIEELLTNVNQEQKNLKEFSDLDEELPFTTIDKREFNID